MYEQERLVRSGSFSLPLSVVRELTEMKPFRFVAHLAAIFSCYVLLAVAGFYCDATVIWIPIWAAQSTLLVGLTAAIHESIHNTLSPWRRFNYIMGVVLSTLIFKNYSYHAAFHLAHHEHTAVEGDTEPRFKLDTVRDYLKEFFSWPSLYFATARNVFNSLRGKFPRFVKSRRVEQQIKRESLLQIIHLLGLIALTAAWPGIVTKSYLIPVFFMGPVGFFFMIPEHHDAHLTEDAAYNTRTIHTNRVTRFMYWNNNYHCEHHAFSFVPFYNLPALHALLKTRIEFVEKSYTSFHWRLLKELYRKSDKHSAAEQTRKAAQSLCP